MESLRLNINEHMTSVGEEILCVLDKQQLKLDVRVFVLERLSATAEFMCNLFQREIETLETLLEKQNKLLDIDFDMDIDLHTAGMSVTHTSNYLLHVGLHNTKLIRSTFVYHFSTRQQHYYSISTCEWNRLAVANVQSEILLADHLIHF